MSTSTTIVPADLLNPQNGLTRTQAEALAKKVNKQAADPLLIIKPEQSSALPTPQQMTNEALAQFIVGQTEDAAAVVGRGLAKMSELMPYIIELRERFEHRGSIDPQPILGCQTWTEFSEKILNRTDRAVRKAIAKYYRQFQPAPVEASVPSLQSSAETAETTSPAPEPAQPTLTAQPSKPPVDREEKLFELAEKLYRNVDPETREKELRSLVKRLLDYFMVSVEEGGL